MFGSRLVCLIFIGNLIYCNAWKSWISPSSSKRLVIELEKDTEPIFPADSNHTSYEQITITNPNINELTTEMQSPISNKTKLFLRHGHINIVHLMVQMDEVSIYNCSTTDIIINSNWTYQTDDFSVVYGKLESLPNHLNVLTKLEKLYLHDNQIEFIEMAEFNGLNKLNLISLMRNKIVEIRATLMNPVILPKLEYFNAYENRLTDVSFEHWNATALHTIKFNENQLQIALSFPSKFPNLKAVKMNNNPFNCLWLNSTLKELKARTNVTINNENETKCDENGPSFDELVRRIKFKETLASIPLSENWKTSFEFSLKMLTFVESVNKNHSMSNDQLRKEIEQQKNNNKKTDAKVSELSANTKLQVEKIQKEINDELGKMTKELSTKEQILDKKVDKMESETNSFKNLFNSHMAESNKSHKQLQQNNEQLEDQIKQLSAKIASTNKNLQTKMGNELLKIANASTKIEQSLKDVENTFQQKIESLQKISTFNKNREENRSQELVTLKLQIERLEQTQNSRLNGTALDVSRLEGETEKFKNAMVEEIQQMAKMLDELQRKMNVSSFQTDKSIFEGPFVLDKYSVILLLLIVLCCLFLMKMLYNSIISIKSHKRRKETPMSEIPIMSYEVPSTKL